MSNKKKNLLPFVAGAVVITALVVTLVGKERAQEQDRLSANEYYNESQGDDFTSQLTPGVGSEEPTNNEVEGTINERGDLVINTADIKDEATFFQLNVKGTNMAVMAVRAEDGTVRTAFDTCQICNGSPYAYFEQRGDKFQCQNCGNVYSRDMIEKERGGCNPVPIMEDEKTSEGEEIIIPVELLEENVERFENWKKL